MDVGGVRGPAQVGVDPVHPHTCTEETDRNQSQKQIHTCEGVPKEKAGGNGHDSEEGIYPGQGGWGWRDLLEVRRSWLPVPDT